MLIRKSVSDENLIVLSIENAPELPENAYIVGPGFSTLYDRSTVTTRNWLNATQAIIGDLCIYLLPLLSYPESMAPEEKSSVESIAKSIIEKVELIWKEYQDFRNIHTDSCEIISKDQVIDVLSNENRLLYRGQDGMFKKLVL